MSETQLIDERLRNFPSAVDDSDWGDVLRRATAAPVTASNGDTGAAVRRVAEPFAPRQRRWSRRRTLGGISALAGAGGIAALILIVFAGTRAPNAFAGWTARPTRPTAGETGAALSACTAKIPANTPAADWQQVVSDTRGPFTAMILKSAGATATCLTGPSFTTAEVNTQEAGGVKHVLNVSKAHANKANASRPNLSVLAPRGANSGPITGTDEAQPTIDGQPYTLLQGQIGPSATRVTFLLSDGSRVQATVADGALVAWWPSHANATSATIANGSGGATQQLAFTSISHLLAHLQAPNNR